MNTTRTAMFLLMRLTDMEPDHGEQQDEVIMHHAADGTLVEIGVLDASTNASGRVRAILRSAPA